MPSSKKKKKKKCCASLGQKDEGILSDLQILYVIFSSVLQACDFTSGCVPGCSQLISASFATFFLFCFCFFLYVSPGILVKVICSEMSNVS